MLERFVYESLCETEPVDLIEKTMKESQNYIVLVVGDRPAGIQAAISAGIGYIIALTADGRDHVGIEINLMVENLGQIAREGLFG